MITSKLVIEAVSKDEAINALNLAISQLKAKNAYKKNTKRIMYELTIENERA